MSWFNYQYLLLGNYKFIIPLNKFTQLNNFPRKWAKSSQVEFEGFSPSSGIESEFRLLFNCLKYYCYATTTSYNLISMCIFYYIFHQLVLLCTNIMLYLLFSLQRTQQLNLVIGFSKYFGFAFAKAEKVTIHCLFAPKQQ